MMFHLHIKFHDKWISSFRGVAMKRSFISNFLVPRDITPTKMRGSKFPTDMHNYILCPIYIPRFMIIGSVVSEELRWQDYGTDGQTDGRSDCTSRPAFAIDDACNNKRTRTQFFLKSMYLQFSRWHKSTMVGNRGHGMGGKSNQKQKWKYWT